jgi:hypothetical protein
VWNSDEGVPATSETGERIGGEDPWRAARW